MKIKVFAMLTIVFFNWDRIWSFRSELRIQNPKVNEESGREGDGFQSKSGVKMGTWI
jgi:hypothetical protein